MRNVLMKVHCDVGLMGGDCLGSLVYEVGRHALAGAFGFGAPLPERWEGLKRPRLLDDPGDKVTHEFAGACPVCVPEALEQGWEKAVAGSV